MTIRKRELKRPREEIVNEEPKPKNKNPRGRPRKSAEEKIVAKVAAQRDHSISAEKDFKCANPTFKVKSGEKKVRKKREKKVKITPKLNQMLMDEEMMRKERAKTSSLLLSQKLLNVPRSHTGLSKG